MRGEKGKGRACGDRVRAAGVLFPQVLCDDAVKGRWGRQVALHLLLHGWSLNTREETVINGARPGISQPLNISV